MNDPRLPLYVIRVCDVKWGRNEPSHGAHSLKRETRNQTDNPKPATHLQPVSLLIKPASGDCNMRCAYCFYVDRPSDPYEHRRSRRMSLDVLDTLIRQGMQLNRRYMAFGWQGGEPTLAGLDFFRKAVELQQRYGFAGQVVANGLQTNGLLLDAQWARFLGRYSFLLGVSLDGPAAYHDHYRLIHGGCPTHERVLPALRLLRQYRVECNVLAVVNRLTADHGAEIYDYFLSQELHHLQFIPCIEMDAATGQLADFSVQPEQLGDFLCAVFDRWYNGGNPQASVRDFEAILSVYLGEEAPLCCYRERCGSYLVVEYNGDLYPCDFYVDEAHRLGNVLQLPLHTLFEGEALRRFAAAKADPRPECAACRWLSLCHQGCPRTMSARHERMRRAFCSAYRRFYAHSHSGFIALRDALLRQRGVDSAGPRASPDPAGRNDLCPCGSGKKYKRCCGQKERGHDSCRRL